MKPLFYIDPVMPCRIDDDLDFEDQFPLEEPRQMTEDELIQESNDALADVIRGIGGLKL